MIHPDIQRFLQHWDGAWASLAPGAGPAERRAHFEKVAAAMREPNPEGIVSSEHWAPVPETGESVRVRMFRPEGADGDLPALIYMHGGAWMQGSPETHWDITAGIAKANQQVVISVDYALAPEQPFPRALNECVAVVKWVSDNARHLRINANAIAIGGDSAGGNLAAATTLVLKGSEYRLSGQLLVYPATDFRMDRPSHIENANGPLVTVASMPAVNAMYCPDRSRHADPLVTPLNAESHADLPPAFVAVAEHDPLRDEGIAYAEALETAGVPVVLDRGESLIHGYLRAKAYCDLARESYERMCAWLQANCNQA